MSLDQSMYMLASRLNEQMILRARVAPLKRPQGQGGPHRSCIEMRAQHRDARHFKGPRRSASMDALQQTPPIPFLPAWLVQWFSQRTENSVLLLQLAEKTKG